MKDGLFFTNMENVDKEEVVSTRAIVEFFTFASEYCIFIDIGIRSKNGGSNQDDAQCQG